LPENRNKADFRNVMLLKRIGCGQVPQKEDFFQLNSFVPCSLFWISWPVKMVPIGSSNMSVRNYHLMNVECLRRLEISHDNLAMQP